MQLNIFSERKKGRVEWVVTVFQIPAGERSLIMAGRGLEGKLKIFNKISQPIRILQNGFVVHH